MKITAINGSPRGKNGNTFVMVEEFLKGAKSEGAEIDHLLLSDKKIHHCIGCFNCWVKTPGKCVFEDDMTSLIPKMNSDILVYASPLYVDNITGLLKNFIDRLVPLASPYFEKDKNGECVHRADENTQLPKLVVISNCGFPEQSHFQVLHLLFQRMARNMHTDVIAEIYRGEGELLKNKNLLLKPFLYRYKKLLQGAGKEIVKYGKLSDELKNKLAKPIIPEEQYIQSANKHWDKELSKINKESL